MGAKIASWVLDFLITKLTSWLAALQRQKSKLAAGYKEAEQAGSKFEEVVKDKTKTREDRRNAEDDFFNS